MTSDEKLSMIKTMLDPPVDDSEDEKILAFLDAAKREIISWRCSYAVNAPKDVLGALFME